ncbi:MAG: hypothetical protein ACI81L_003688, partial [Verrucomicrobiales bacterium]
MNAPTCGHHEKWSGSGWLDHHEGGEHNREYTRPGGDR